jgi:hypothetical protein
MRSWGSNYEVNRGNSGRRYTLCPVGVTGDTVNDATPKFGTTPVKEKESTKPTTSDAIVGIENLYRKSRVEKLLPRVINGCVNDTVRTVSEDI